MNTGDTAWLLISAALVLFMVPGLALFYGGMVRRKNVLSTLMHSFVAVPIVSILWVAFGYSLAFGPSHKGLIGDFSLAGLGSLADGAQGTTPSYAFVLFQMMFAAITPALVSGAFAERMKFRTYIAFVVLFCVFVYLPVAHWVWAPDGWIFKLHALDFAGGTVVHMTAGAAALVGALLVGKRLKYPHETPVPHNLTMTLTGTGLLWFGWFGFNAGSALAANKIAALAALATHLGACGGAIGWVAIEWSHRGKPTALGVASGIVAGLVAITPAAGFVAPWAAIVVGLLAGVVCYGGVLLKHRYGYDDSLDAFGVHGVGGLFGAIATGIFADTRFNPDGGDGLIRGQTKQFFVQLLACAVVGLYAAAVSALIFLVLKKTMGLRVEASEEREGLDETLHGETGYAG